MNTLYKLRILLVVWKALQKADLTNVEVWRLSTRPKELKTALIEVFQKEELSGFSSLTGW